MLQEVRERHSYPLMCFYERVPDVSESKAVGNMDLGSVVMTSKIDRVNQLLEIQGSERMSMKIPKGSVGEPQGSSNEDNGCIVA